ncbi:hypothetical protein CLV35_3851 [Motilibacter peucedani]|uniref:Primosomal protein n=1 Tax=Motilibacter peucedani TaxID=598650 RepID=A0A420XKA2_9ACTN|nr:primosomal protein [Motilibacter peucedani]RKS67945.1 hypothetical protein CLV35_3851 [Motilibacter peucedani]
MPAPDAPGSHLPDPTEEDVRTAARAFVTAFDRHLRTVETRSGEADPRVAEAFGELRTAFLDYEDTLYDVYDEVVPFEVVEDDEFDDDEDDDEDELDDELDEDDDEGDEDVEVSDLGDGRR